MTTTALVWMRRDLRLTDNASVSEALSSADDVVVCACAPSARWNAGAPAGWRCASLQALAADLSRRGGRLVYRDARAEEAVPELAHRLNATVVTCTRDWTPDGLAEERAVRDALQPRAELRVAEGSLLVAPDALATKSGSSFQVYTPFSKAWFDAWEPSAPAAAPADLPCPRDVPAGDDIPSAESVDTWWVPGEAGAAERLARFVDEAIERYAEDRDRPDLRGTSELSPYLAVGAISPNQVAWTVMRSGAPDEAVHKYLAEMGWREFAYHVLHAHPSTVSRPLREQFESMPWCDDPRDAEAWATARTGFPIVDAGMRQLASLGWVHNRVRLVVGSFLTKDLLVRWNVGEATFADRLVDYDTASNVFNWQWVSGCGADAAPYFRIFNPMIQGGRFDPDGAYVRTWVPELAGLENRYIHAPWTAPSDVLAQAGVRLGDTYPQPVIDHFEARDRALAAFAAIRDEQPPAR